MNIQQVIRLNVRNNQRAILNFLKDNYLVRENGKARNKPSQSICLFCAATNEITVEHVLPRWVFEKDANRIFKTTINGLSHKYNQTTISACSNCNNNLLAAIENKILQIFLAHRRHDLLFDDEERALIIRWFEIVDYKYQVFSLVTKFRALKDKGVIPFLSDYSLSVLDLNINYSPAVAIRNLRASLRRISIKSKEQHFNSLVTFKTKNSGMHFFHKNNDFMFLELPKYNLALLYFYTRMFQDELDARDSALEVIKSSY